VKKVLITGIEGFVGQHLADYLTNHSYQISGIFFAEPEKKVGRLYHCDIRDYPLLLKIFKEDKPEAIFHLAAQSSVSQAEKNLTETFAINTQGTLNILEAVRTVGINTRMIYVSSCEVYGLTANLTHQLTELSQTNSVSFYALSKLMAEQVCQYYYKQYKLETIILRPFSHTGPGQSENFIFPKIARRIAEIEYGIGKANIIIGNLDVVRDYTDISDIIKAYHQVLEKCEAGEIYNITSGKSYSIRNGVDFLLSLSKKKIEVRVSENLKRANDIPLLTGNADKFVNLTGWKPKLDFYTTLTNLLNYYRMKLAH
jgi:GDP-4-dehydro-6-deoxy-D-mannose reductase